MNVIVFDFDKTLTRNDTLYGFFSSCEENRLLKIFKSVLFFISAFLCKIKFISNTSLKKFGIFLYLRNLGEENLNLISRRYAKKIHFNDLYNRNQFITGKNKYFVVSASFSCYLKYCFPTTVTIVASELKIENGKILGLNKNCYSTHKVSMLNDLGVYHIDHLYTDSYSDYPMAMIANKITIIRNNHYTSIGSASEFRRFFKR